MNLPNTLTVIRIFLVPFLVVVLLAPPSRLADGPFFGASSPAPREILGVAIFLVAIITDFFDGFLARRRNQITTLGTLLDPIADKLLVTSAFISLVQMGLAPAWMVVIIVGREFIVSGLRSVLATQGIALPASPWGKLKTTTQSIAIVLLISTRTLDRWGQWGFLGVLLLWLAMILALVSAADYTWKFLRTVQVTAPPAQPRPKDGEERARAAKEAR